MTIVYIVLGCIIVVSLVVGIILTKKENKSTGTNASLIQQESVNGAIEMLKENSNTKEVVNTSSSVNSANSAVDVMAPPVVSSPVSTSVTPLPVDNPVGEGVVSTPVNNVVQQVPNVDNQTVVTPTVLVQSVDDDSEVL